MTGWAVRRRRGFTLIELLLSLALIVVATALIGSLISLYARSFATRGEDIRRQQLARRLLSMIADDIRAVVVEQPFDGAVLQQMLGSAGSSSSGSQLLDEPELETTDVASTAAPATSSFSDTDLLSTLGGSMPPGIYGTEGQLMIDVSRVPRADEFILPVATPGTLVDMPGDIKRVTYYIQSPTPLGVRDTMSDVATASLEPGRMAGLSSGLVRRRLDRAVSNFAETNGNTLQFISTGDLMAPEVGALEFAFLMAPSGPTSGMRHCRACPGWQIR